MSHPFHFICTECSAEYAEDRSLLVCPACSVHQLPGRETRGVLEVALESLPSRWPEAALHDAAFLRPFLPVGESAHFAPLAVGGTPLLPVPGLRRHLGMPQLWVKDDTRNPSGSTKDRASLLVAAKAAEYGFSTIATASTGNAATALAAVAAAAGREAVVFVPESAPPAKLVQILAYGAHLIPVAGSYDQAFELCLESCERFGWYNRNTALNPFTIEGKKTAALEIAAQLGPATADVIVVPTGDGVILAGIAKGYADLHAAGLVSRVPRLIAVQPAGAAAIVAALRAGTETVTRVEGATSVADSLTVETPRNARLCLQRIRESGGAGVTVSDEAIVAAIARLARYGGVFAEPAAAAALAGLETALEAGLVTRDENVVLLITGNGLKDIPAAHRSVSIPRAIPPQLDAVVELVGRG